MENKLELSIKDYLIHNMFYIASITIMKDANLVSPLPKRLKAARKAAGYSQSKLGILCGIDESSAAPRINQYEKGTHSPTYLLVAAFAKALDVPPYYFYIEDDKMAEIACRLNQLAIDEIQSILDKTELVKK